jgi:hypothetical protein
MAVYHQAFLFDPDSAHRRLATDQLSADRAGGNPVLREGAKQAVASVSLTTKEYLRLLCFDVNELEASSAGEVDFRSCYLAYLGSYITSPQPLSNASFAVLEIVLPLLGWKPDQLRLALVGRSLRSLLSAYGLSGRPEELMTGMRHVSWMSANDVDHCAGKLKSNEGYILSASALLLDALSRLPDHVRGSATRGELLQRAHFEISQRFAAASHLELALLLINDSNSYLVSPGPDPI